MHDEDVVTVLGVRCPGSLYLWDYLREPLAEGGFRVDTLYSGFSAGTELTFVKGSNPALAAHWDERYGVFEPGKAGIDYPVRFLGYMEVGRIRESRTPAVREGQLVAMAYGHKSGHDADPSEDFFVLLPDDLDPLAGIWVAQMGPICANGLLHAAVESVGTDVRSLGDGVRGRCAMVYGGGIVGTLTALLAVHGGAAEVMVADDNAFRRIRLQQLGLIALPEAEAWRWCKDRWNHSRRDCGADIVFQCKASAAALHECLRSLRPQGTVIDLAFYQGGAQALRLGEEFHHNGLTVRCAQIGRMPRGTAHAWSRARLSREIIDWLRLRGKPLLDSLVTHRIAFREAPDFIERLVVERPDFMQIAFDMQDEPQTRRSTDAPAN